MASNWNEERIPDLSGKTAIVTGGNSGIGFEAAKQLALKGAKVILACRSEEKANAAAEAIRSAGEVDVETRVLDLADLKSIGKFSKEFLPDSQTTAYFSATMPGSWPYPFGKPRTVSRCRSEPTISATSLSPEESWTPSSTQKALGWSTSVAELTASVAFRLDDLNWKNGYRKWLAYGQSKLANLLFTYELQRRLASANAETISVACHPRILSDKPTIRRTSDGRLFIDGTPFLTLGNQLVAQPASMGCLPTLYAATVEDMKGGDYIGPDGMGEVRGYPKKVGSNAPLSRHFRCGAFVASVGGAHRRGLRSTSKIGGQHVSTTEVSIRSDTHCLSFSH